MRVDPATGLLDAAHYLPSPNGDDRPLGVAIDLIVIHGISLPPGEFGGPWIDALFANTLDLAAHSYFQTLSGLRVSAHLLIRRDGELTQYVPYRCVVEVLTTLANPNGSCSVKAVTWVRQV
jgi:AmpD protein